MELTVDEIKRLAKKYPYLRPTSMWTGMPIEDWDYTYINGVGDLPKGWERLFLLFCKHLRDELEKFNFVDKFSFCQIKEKYGSMRCYNNGYPKESIVTELDYIFEHLSTYICERCGKPAKYETHGWIGQYCENCFKKFNETEYAENPNNCKMKRRKFVITVKGWANGSCYTKKYYSKPYWEEYLKCIKMTDEEFLNYICPQEIEEEEEHGY